MLLQTSVKGLSYLNEKLYDEVLFWFVIFALLENM